MEERNKKFREIFFFSIKQPVLNIKMVFFLQTVDNSHLGIHGKIYAGSLKIVTMWFYFQQMFWCEMCDWIW